MPFFDSFPRFVNKHDLESLTKAVSRMSEGNFVASVPPMEGSLKDLSRALMDLKKTVATEIDDLQEKQGFLDRAVNSIPSSVLLFQRDRLVFANKTMQEKFNVNLTHYGRNLDDLPLPQDIKNLVGEIPNRVKEESEHVGQTSFDPLGNTYRVLVRSVPGADMRSAFTIVSIADTTEQSRTNLMRKDFVVAASHELKTPVSGVSAMSEAARGAIEDGDLDAAKEFIEQVELSATHLRRLVNDLLDLSRFEEEHQSEGKVDVRSAIESAVFARAVTASAKGVEVRSNLEAVGEESVFAKIDETDFTIALDNLIDNAISFSDDGVVEVRLEADPYKVWIHVVDSGIGIAEADIPRIFERFYRVDRSRSQKSGGTGLGLSLVKHAVMSAGGEISVTSEVGKGTTFSITLQRAYF